MRLIKRKASLLPVEDKLPRRTNQLHMQYAFETRLYYYKHQDWLEIYELTRLLLWEVVLVKIKRLEGGGQ
jgi:hypothetical protein